MLDGARTEVVVVGGGVMGCAVAWQLARRGAQVVVLEKAVPGAEASSAAAGILGAQAETDGPGAFLSLCLASRRRWPAFVEALQADAGMSVAYRETGLFEVAFDPADAAALRARAAWMQRAGLRAELLTGDEARRREPALGHGVSAALDVPDDHSVDPRLLCRALAAAARQRGVRFEPDGEVLAIEVVERGGPGAEAEVHTRSHTFVTPHVVVAAGAWTSRLLERGPAGTTTRTEVHPMHGQMAMLDGRPGLLGRTFASHRGYLVPRADGRVVLGSTMEDRGFRKEVTAAGLRRLLELAMTVAPALGDARVVEHWSGLRPATRDGLPLIGRRADGSPLVFASGHHRNGILLTPATAAWVAAEVLGDGPALGAEVDVAAFRP
jgi:glycine oxidase